jgi:hypothetical protein
LIWISCSDPTIVSLAITYSEASPLFFPFSPASALPFEVSRLKTPTQQYWPLPCRRSKARRKAQTTSREAAVQYYAITQPTPNTTTQPQTLTCHTQTSPHLHARTTPPYFPAPHSATSPACPHRDGHAHIQAPITTTTTILALCGCRCLACLLLAPQPSQPAPRIHSAAATGRPLSSPASHHHHRPQTL